MDTRRDRFVTGPDADGTLTQLQVGLRHAMDLALGDPENPRLLMTFSARQVLDRIFSRIETLVGSTAPSLWKNGRSGASRFQIITDQDSPLARWSGPVFLAYPNPSMLSRVGGMLGVTAEVVVPWTADQKGPREWIAAWSPEPIGTAKKHPIASPVLSAEARVALHQLTEFVGVGNNLAPTVERDEAIAVFETLIEFDRSFDPAAAHAHLIGREGWPGAMADRAIRIIEDLRAGKRIRGRKGPCAQRFALWHVEHGSGAVLAT